MHTEMYFAFLSYHFYETWWWSLFFDANKKWAAFFFTKSILSSNHIFYVGASDTNCYEFLNWVSPTFSWSVMRLIFVRWSRLLADYFVIVFNIFFFFFDIIFVFLSPCFIFCWLVQNMASQIFNMTMLIAFPFRNL